ncbi:hypothetical protein FDI21_gp042 [Pseudomonas phage Noxifer]|uniref:Uncharacterized protein n=1 Tax=Pseudomonas phage Noxifer TaxID=2006684 RepID=A0A1Y0SZK5_9CAUD|nr:hypothetical protein FDI21_gp042 [Pseudomonas phage Noxifer]ARV77213.1 hypothetical protein NOXIFER_42 [Pseudomonas phage Noxifer]
MNVAICFHSEAYKQYVDALTTAMYEVPEEHYDVEACREQGEEDGFVFVEPTEPTYDPVRLLQDITRSMTLRFYDYLVPNSIDREELLNDDDAMLRLLTELLIQVEKIYPDAHVIGFHPVNLKGQMMVVLQMQKPVGGQLSDVTIYHF